MEKIFIDKEQCTLCKLCIPVCLRRILEEGDETIGITDPEQCFLCGHCKAVCPEDAPQLPSLNSEEFEPVPRKEELPDAEQLMDLFRSRRSVRIYRRDLVEQEKLERIIQAGRFAPTGGNRQPLNYVVIHTEKLKQIRDMAMDALADQAKRIERAVEKHRKTGEPLSHNDQLRQGYVARWSEMPNLLKQGTDSLFYDAPALIVCHVDPMGSPTPDVDACLASMQMVLMAEALGLGTCFCAFLVFAIEESLDLRKALQIPEDHIVSSSFMVGYPDVKFVRFVSREPAKISWL